MRRALLPLTLLALTISPAGLVAQTPAVPHERPLDVGQYVAELDRWIAACAKLSDHPEAAGGLRDSLPKSWPVEVDGQTFVVPAHWLAANLQSVEKHPHEAAATAKQMQSRLRALRAEALMLSQASSASHSKAAREKLDGILSRREFRNAQEPAWLAQYRRRLAGWILDAFRELFGGVHIPPRATKTVGWVLAIGLPLAFLIWLIRTFVHRPLQRTVAAPKNLPLQEGWGEWMRRAAAAAARGQYRDAVRLTYWAGVYRLEESGVWQVERARTPREYLRLLPAVHPQQPALSKLTTRFERIWYGGQAASAEDFVFTKTRLEELECAFPSIPATGNS